MSSKSPMDHIPTLTAFMDFMKSYFVIEPDWSDSFKTVPLDIFRRHSNTLNDTVQQPEHSTMQKILSSPPTPPSGYGLLGDGM